MTKPQNIETIAHVPTLIIGIQAPYNDTENIDAYYDEFKNLLKTNGTTFDAEHFIKIREINQKTFITPGKLEEIRKLCEKHAIEEVYISEPITTLQAKHLEDYLNCKVFDRTDLILEIFKKAAQTAEGKTQVAIATLEHAKTRLAGKGIFLEQQRGGGGAGTKGGPGETLKEREKRVINAKIQQLRKQLETLHRARETQRKKRIAAHVPQICLIGYTNAGKSTILNTLTKAQVLAENKLFATLDTTTRELYINGIKKGVLSDTVGFIQYLPHKLIDAFKSTLSELQYADLLLEVVDASDPDWKAHIDVVQDILDDLEVEKPILYVFNKIDKCSEEIKQRLEDDAQKYQPYVIISAKERETMKPLIDFLDQWKVEKLPS
ncbi:TPA: GTPase HflX [Candidatus Dependentiae bacterium]|nr:MAG: GTPase HflX [candidate division TM6 bacterium GW2011_GWF2_36_131]KKQ02830.1 MAG: GTPase HflX [candidate division TM6 bacterium GW2011_GWE2_36_25]KKQ18961.1 MAG: GTPase HflX [candidate division TM6 bacterium GW2011_GWA2_36_9]HBR71008.1 GTPase HflX [Candidatus Dependentiae bacterium]HCU00229.1 GTPase HflX [Candidatus Dependentiae bacterium]